MSHSPRTVQEIGEYEAGWDATMRLVRQGRSWSGNERNCAFLNARGGRFATISAVTGLDYKDDGRSMALVDWDHDGDQDLWLHNRTGPRLRLMLNQSGDSTRRRSVGLRLRGTTSNRDGIGARVEVKLKDGPPLIQTLYAGHGFRSQSSKWLHFGLGDSRIENVTVDWPGGKTEIFSGISTGRRYVLEQATGMARDQADPHQALALQPSSEAETEPTGSGRVVLSRRFPRLGLGYAGFDDAPQVADQTGKPLLVNLWASWCAPCVEELQALTAESAKLQSAGLDVLALTVEGLNEEDETTPEDAKRLLDEVGFPFRSGRATTELLDKLDLLQRVFFQRVPAFGVPTSFLLDQEGRIAVIYRGPVEASQLVDDMKLLSLTGPSLLQAALPASGQWYGRYLPAQAFLLELSDRFEERYPAESLRFLQEAYAFQESRSKSQLNPAQQKQLTSDRAETLFRLGAVTGALDRPQDAARFYQMALRLDANRAQTWTNMANVLLELGFVEEAVKHASRAIEITPSAEAHNNLGLALFMQAQFDQAIGQYQRALELDPGSQEVHYNLGVVFSISGETGQAVEHFLAALELDPNSLGPLTDLAWIRATCPEAAFRNAKQGVQLAERAARIAGMQDSTVLDTLAAAYAEAGQFDRAVETGRAALLRAEREQNGELAAFVRQRLALYEQSKPYREPVELR